MTMAAVEAKIDVDVKSTPLKMTTPSSSATSFHRKYKWVVFFIGMFAAAAIFILTEAEAMKEGFLAEKGGGGCLCQL
jgi:hypothetical protein